MFSAHVQSVWVQGNNEIINIFLNLIKTAHHIIYLKHLVNWYMAARGINPPEFTDFKLQKHIFTMMLKCPRWFPDQSSCLSISRHHDGQKKGLRI